MSQRAMSISRCGWLLLLRKLKEQKTNYYYTWRQWNEQIEKYSEEEKTRNVSLFFSVIITFPTEGRTTLVWKKNWRCFGRPEESGKSFPDSQATTSVGYSVVRHLLLLPPRSACVDWLDRTGCAAALDQFCEGRNDCLHHRHGCDPVGEGWKIDRTRMQKDPRNLLV